jgi:organic hydroperoxide reductase OsmC/OhrA
VVRADDLPHVLGVEASRERGRADEVAEHDRELAALSGVQRVRRGRRRSRNGDCRCALLNGFEIGNRAQQLSAMAEQDAQLLQILIRQIGEDAVPEEAFVASLSSCHMLTFLAIACKQKFLLDSYQDEAVGHMEKNAEGKMAITLVELRPKITWGGDRTPSAEQLDEMHHAAHENCFIANSVKTKVTVTKL